MMLIQNSPPPSIRRVFGVFLIILSLFSSISTAKSQSLDAYNRGFVYDRERVYDFRLQTHGWWTIGMRYGRIKTYYKTSFYEFNLGELRHPKETARASEFSGLGDNPFGTYVFGKQNKAFVLRAGIGKKRYYSEKAVQKGVALSVNYAFGANLLFLKPYYLTLRSQDLPSGIDVRYSPETAKDFLDVSKIEDNAAFFVGINQISVLPGGYARAGLQIDGAISDKTISALEVGMQVDIFPKRIPIMVSEQNRAYFLNFYLSLQFGKRR
jgi:hypothetical protein